MQIDDCIAQCAAEFGGGRGGYLDLGLWALLQWTDRAIKRERARHEFTAALQGAKLG